MNKLQNLIDFPDCYALSEYGKCAWLTVSECEGESCPFKRTRQDDIDCLEHSYRRLSSLDNSTQSRIAKKYYSGFMPWNAEQNGPIHREVKKHRSHGDINRYE